jgi:hypothetical protein
MQPRKRAYKKRQNWIARIPPIWRAVIFVLGVPGLYVGILSLLPRISVNLGDPLRSGQPLSTPILVSNDGILSIHDAYLMCVIDSLKFDNGNVVAYSASGQMAGDPYQLGDLGPNGRATTFCGPDPGSHGKIIEGHVVLLVSFRPDFLPWRTTREFHVRGVISENNSFHWVQTSN